MLLDSAIYLYPLLITNEDADKNEKCIYLGINPELGNRISWCIDSAFTSHTFIIGPSGSGKTISLATIASRFNNVLGSKVIVFDIKDEYRLFLKLFNLEHRYIDPLKTPIPLCYCNEDKDIAERRINIFINVVSKVYSISPMNRRFLREYIHHLCSHCLPVESLYDIEQVDSSLSDAINDIVSSFSVYTEKSFDPLIHIMNNNVIFNLKPLFSRSRALSTITIFYVLTQLLSSQNIAINIPPRYVIVLDELWNIAPYIIDDLINILARYSRSYGISIFMSTQSIDDINPHAEAVIGNCNMVLALSSQSYSYWLRVSKYLNLSKRMIEKALIFSDHGTGIIRMHPHYIPSLIYIDPFEG